MSSFPEKAAPPSPPPIELSGVGKEAPASIRTDGKRQAIHPGDVHGRFLRWRRGVWAALILMYLGLPFVKVRGNPAVLLDIPGRRFHLFGAAFNAQDVWLLVFLVLAFGMALLFFSAWLGRAFCGWACPQTVLLEGVFRRIERWIEGSRERRLALAAAPWTARKIVLKGAEQLIFLGLSWVLGHVFLSYFVGIERLYAMILEGPRAHLTTFMWGMAATGLTYFNFAYFREQVCVLVCPYGRLQSILVDPDSLIVGYDRARGEPRGKLLRLARAQARLQGDCVDCRRCVAVCPTGIDIRNGLQMECVACAQCADACDAVMERLKWPKGLIRYGSLRELSGGGRRVFRPRLVVYGLMLAASVVAMLVGVGTRTPFEANLLRVQGAPWVLDGEWVRNQFELHLVNKSPVASTFQLEIRAPAKAEFVVPIREVELAPMQGTRLPVFAGVRRAELAGPFDVTVEVVDMGSAQALETGARFLAPP